MVSENLDTFAKRLDHLLKGVSNREVERQTKINNVSLSEWRNGKTSPTLEKIEPLRKYFGEKFSWLISGMGSPDGEFYVSDKDIKYTATKFKSVPIVGTVPCGIPVTSWEIDDNKLMKLADVGHMHSPFILIAKGDSMSPYINNRDYILCADMPEKIKKDKTAVVVSFKSDPDSFNANAKLIKWRKPSNEIMLYSINTKYEPEIYPIKDIYKIYKVVRIIRDVN